MTLPVITKSVKPQRPVSPEDASFACGLGVFFAMNASFFNGVERIIDG
jgi:hypothetical protein